ncbi:TPA: hypothetical protein O4U00_002848 [Staphylococcus aureus]|uniref:hypothetical protein n=1 Tax=Staphylococcus aureus TaxID=1280 RepID=UPI000A79E075|nr:hypothetical protein [Staphylococcus aureus]CAC6886692.1 Uncharacterised protein [Staphylococcus aureus]HAR7187195.1 hypothetical protein [Staphylococcus aureus]HAR7224435.1 hypothetical protein [Staphylococcus aureus]HAR7244735.1 hypothetical protein [Staphylococcus aureus]
MTGLKVFLIICISAFIGNFILMIFESMPINIWVARFIGGVAAAISGMLLTYYFQKNRIEE